MMNQARLPVTSYQSPIDIKKKQLHDSLMSCQRLVHLLIAALLSQCLAIAACVAQEQMNIEQAEKHVTDMHCGSMPAHDTQQTCVHCEQDDILNTALFHVQTPELACLFVVLNDAAEALLAPATQAAKHPQAWPPKGSRSLLYQSSQRIRV